MSLLNILWAVLLAAVIVFVIYLILLIKEAVNSLKITNKMLLEVDKELPQIVGDVSSAIHATNTCAMDLTKKVKDVTGFLSVVGMFLGGFEGAKAKIGKDLIQKAMPSKKTSLSVLAGLRRAIEVLLSPPSKKS